MNCPYRQLVYLWRHHGCLYQKGFLTIGTLKVNRTLYPWGIKQKVSKFVLDLQKADATVSLVTVGRRSHYILPVWVKTQRHWKCSGADQLPEGWIPCFQISVDFYQHGCFLKHSGDSEQLCRTMAGGGVIRQSKDKLSFDRHQIRSSKEIRWYWLLMSLTHLITCTRCVETMSFKDGYTYIYSHIQKERLRFIYQCRAKHIVFNTVWKLVA